MSVIPNKKIMNHLTVTEKRRGKIVG